MKRSRRSDLVALVVYAATSFAYFGWPLVRHPGRVVVGPAGDPSIFIWSFAWWPHALGSATNPLHSTAVFAPGGVNLAWATSVPGLALAFWPLTALAGPVVSFNVAELLMPALSAWTAYLLCRYLFRSFWASLVGGYLFGFSSYVLGHLNEGQLNLTAVFLLPLVALVVLRGVRGELAGRGLAWRLGVLLALQLAISTEVALTLTIVLALGLLLGFWLMRDARAGVRASVLPLVAGYGIGALLAAPLVVYVLAGGVPESFTGANLSRSDLLNFAVPTEIFGLGGSSLHGLSGRFPRGGQEQGAYLGLPVLLVLGVLALRLRRSATVRFLLAGVAVTALIALGDSLHVAGRRLVAMPWALAARLPLLDNTAPSRFTVYLWLAVAVAVALWTATTRGLVFDRPYVLPALAVASLLPAVWQPHYHSPLDRPAFFADRTYETCLPRGETVAIFPLVQPGKDAMLWQAESGFWFRMAGGSLGPGLHGIAPLESDQSEPVAWELNYLYGVGRPTMARLLAYAALHHVGRVLSLETGGYPSAGQMRAFGPVQRVGGMLVAPACGRPPLTSRDLSTYVRTYDDQLRSQSEIGYCDGPNYRALPVGLYPAGALAAAKPASFVAGRGLTCEAPPAGYVRRGFATADLGVRVNTYPLYVPRGAGG